MTSAVSCLTSLSCVSNELFAEAIKSPSTSAAIVPIRPAPSLTTSFASEPRWCLGSLLRNNIPTSVPAKIHPNAITDNVTGLIVFITRRYVYLHSSAHGNGRNDRLRARAVRQLADNRQNIDVVFTAHLAPEDRILKQSRKLRGGANASDGAERSTEHDRARHKFCFAAGARHQVGGIAHRQQRALLVFHTLAVNADVRTQDQLVPVAGNLIETPQGFADHVGT